MKRLEEIQNEYARKCGFKDWENLILETAIRKGSSIGKLAQVENYYEKVTEIYAREVAQASLEKIKRILQVRFTRTEIKHAFEFYYDKIARL
ncbi:hypothetical protein [Elizabethkingia meningoseptica]|uniref:hypothetical protein n=1 Tax=Elizabethkingia meningoseptica TaxID=238 RepID=UPI0038914D25